MPSRPSRPPVRTQTAVASAEDVAQPSDSSTASAAVVAQAFAVASGAQAEVAAEDAHAAGAAASAAAIETAAAVSAATRAAALLSAATATIHPPRAGHTVLTQRSSDMMVEAALRAAADAEAGLAAAAAGQEVATNSAATKVALAVSVAAAAATYAATAEAAAVEDQVSNAARLATTIATSLAAAASDEVTTAALVAAAVAASLAAAVEDEVTSAAVVAAAIAASLAANVGDEVASAARAAAAVSATLEAQVAATRGAQAANMAAVHGTAPLSDVGVTAEWDTCSEAPLAPDVLPNVDPGEVSAARFSLGLRRLVQDLDLVQRVKLALSESEDRFQISFEHAPVGLLLAEFDGEQFTRFLRVNAAMCRLTGYSEAALLALDPRALSRPDGVVTPPDPARGCYRDSEDRQYVQQWMHADGYRMMVRVSLRPVPDPDGGPVFAVGQVEDVTSRLRQDAALRHSREQLRMAFDSAPIATMLIRLTGKDAGGLIKANAAACRLTGYSEAELLASDLDALLGDSVVDGSLQRRATGRYGTKKRYRHADGHTFLARFHARLLPGEDGQGDCIVAQIHEDDGTCQQTQSPLEDS